MNIAFPAVLLFMLVLPGLLFRYTYQRGFFRRSPITVPSFTEDLGFSILWAVVLHAIWLNIFSIAGLRIDYGTLLTLLIGQFGKDQAYLTQAIQAITAGHAAITSYFLSLFVAGYLLGYGAHFLVRSQRWDRRFPLLRFSNEWHYLFSGEDALAPATTLKPDVYITAVVEFKEATYLYRGTLVSWTFDRQGILERLTLEQVSRRRLEKDRSDDQPYNPVSRGQDSRYYSVEGDLFIMRYSEIKTLNVEYVYLLPVD